MDRMPSAEFRRSFARLTEPTLVTVHGHPIGTWTPVIVAPDGGQGAETTTVATEPRVAAPAGRRVVQHGFGTSRPAPKSPKPGR
jgi:hypothetical protein